MVATHSPIAAVGHDVVDHCGVGQGGVGLQSDVGNSLFISSLRTRENMPSQLENKHVGKDVGGNVGGEYQHQRR